MVSVLVVDHPPAVRRSLSARLSLEPDIVVVAEAGDVLAAADRAQALRPSVVVLDAEMPNLDVREAVRLICAQAPASACVVLSLYPDAVRRVLGPETARSVGKGEGTAALLDAIRSAAGR
jgi:DNA-binding NarL/FixJ family response regulator